MKNSAMLIAFAWIMEIVGVTGSVINCVYTTVPAIELLLLVNPRCDARALDW
jgi:hypothetical protein